MLDYGDNSIILLVNSHQLNYFILIHSASGPSCLTVDVKNGGLRSHRNSIKIHIASVGRDIFGLGLFR